MTLFDYLQTPVGIELSHAVILVLLALAGFLTWVTKRTTDENARKLNGHLEQHIAELAHTSPGDVVESDPKM